MATYIPGIEDQIPQSKPFVPDYKFLSDVLQTRQDRYDSNYKQLNDVYGKVLHADLTRNDNKYIRDQYTKQLAPQVKQISGLDLSLQSNVDSAYALFKPFYEDKHIIKDLTATATLSQERKKMNSFKDSSVRSVREQYWDYGKKGLDLWEEDFKNDDPEKALSRGLPRYISDVDLVEQSEMLLDDSKLGDTEDVFISQDNKWIIKQKSGSLITSVPTGNITKVKTPDGKEIMVPETKNLALDYIKDRLMDDPNVQAAYHLRNYVDMREYIKENSKEGESDDVAKQAWANSIIEKFAPQYENEISDLSKIKENKKLEVSSWESYAKKVGINPGSQDDIKYMNSLDELKLVDETITSAKNKLQNATAATDDVSDLLNKAYSLAMASQMGGDMLAAASSYAAKTMTRSQEVNPLYAKWIEHQYALQRIALQESLKDAREKKNEAKEDPQTVPLYRRREGTGVNMGGDINVNEDIVGEDKGLFNQNNTKDGVSDAINNNHTTAVNEIDANNEAMKDIIKNVYLKNAADLNLSVSTFTPIFSPELMINSGKIEIATLSPNATQHEIMMAKVGTGVAPSTSNTEIEVKKLHNKKDSQFDPRSLPETVAHYPKSTAMTWDEFNKMDDPEKIEQMYNNALNFIDNAETKFPSYMLLDNKSKKEISTEIGNLRGIMGDFNNKTTAMADQYLKTQMALVGVDEDFEGYAVDGGSIFDKNGYVIPKDKWVKRYVDKWTDLSNKDMNEFVRNNPTGTLDGTSPGEMNPQAVANFEKNIENLRKSNEKYEVGLLEFDQFKDFYRADGMVRENGIWKKPPVDDINQMYLPNINADFDYESMPSLRGGKYWSVGGVESINVSGPYSYKMEEDASKAYDYMYIEMNKKMTANAENGKEFGYNLSAALNNMPYDMGSGMAISSQYEYYYSQNASEQENAGAIDFVNQLYQILDGDKANFSIYAGGNLILDEGETLGNHNEEMKKVLDEIYFDMLNNYGKPKDQGGSGSPSASSLDFSITYSKNMGGKDINAAGYEITLPAAYVKNLLSGSSYSQSVGEYQNGFITKENSKKFLKDNTLTILVSKEVDFNNFKTGNRDERWVINEMKKNKGIITREVAGGGRVSVFEIKPGQFVLNTELMHYENGTGTLVPGLTQQISQQQISSVLTTQEDLLIQLSESNIQYLKDYNTVNSNKY